MSSTFSNQFPRLNSPFVDSAGLITEPWVRVLQALWNRTGGAAGSNVTNINNNILFSVADGFSEQYSALGFQNLLDGPFANLPPAPQEQDPFSLATYPNQPESILNYAPGRFYPLVRSPVSATGAVAAADRIYLVPFFVREMVSIVSFFARVITGGSGSAAKFGLWSTRRGLPTGTPIVADNTGVSTTASGVIVTFTGTSVVLRSGWYYYGVKVTSATRPVFLNIPGTHVDAASLHGANTASEALGNGATVQAAGIYVDDAYANPMPDLTSASFSTSTGASQGVPVLAVETA